MSESPRSPLHLLARTLLGGGRVAMKLLPARVQKAIEDRFFYAVFNVTRVTNDHYGWRPDSEDEEEGPTG